MKDVIIVKPEKCVGCNACVRVCPAKEANATKQLDDGRFITTVNPEKCISCGECVRACQHGARDYKDDTEEAINRMSREKMILMVAPAIKSAFPTKWKGILDWFRRKGCLIYDVSFGADICVWAHLRSMEHNKVGNIITQPCAAIVRYIELYQPKLLQNLSPVHSPVGCDIVYVRKYLRRNNPIAFLSPCIAKKTEFEETGLADYNITFAKLKDYFERNGISIPSNSADDLNYDFEERQGQVGAIFPRPGGLRDNLWMHNPDINISTSEGVHKVYPELDLYAEMPEYKHPEVFDVLSCEFGCNIGPGSGNEHSIFDVMATMREVEKESKTRRKTGFLGKGEDKLFKYFDENLELQDFYRNYKPATPSPIPTEVQLDSVYESMGKHTPQARTYNCHACGYPTCRDMAIAIYRGLNTPDNCIVHAKSVLTARHSELISQHERLSEITDECLALSSKLKSQAGEVTDNLISVDDVAQQLFDKAATVKDLLNNIIDFCNENQTMDEESVSMLTDILKTTHSAFGTLDESVGIAGKGSAAIKTSMKEINVLVDDINGTLEKVNGQKK